MVRMATDFRDGKTFPRRGRERMGEALWLARVFDKARASAADTIFDYIYPCPMDKGVMERWGVTPEEFDDAIRAHATDDAILSWLESRTTPERIAAVSGIMYWTHGSQPISMSFARARSTLRSAHYRKGSTPFCGVAERPKAAPPSGARCLPRRSHRSPNARCL